MNLTANTKSDYSNNSIKYFDSNKKNNSNNISKNKSESIIENSNNFSEEQNAIKAEPNENFSDFIQYIINQNNLLADSETNQLSDGQTEIANKDFLKLLDKLNLDMASQNDAISSENSKEAFIKDLLGKIQSDDLANDAIKIEYLGASIKNANQKDNLLNLMADIVESNQNSSFIKSLELVEKEIILQSELQSANSSNIEINEENSQNIAENFKIAFSDNKTESNINQNKIIQINEHLKNKEINKEEFLAKILASDENSPLEKSPEMKIINIQTDNNDKSKDNFQNNHLSFLNIKSKSIFNENSIKSSSVEIKAKNVDELVKIVSNKAIEIKNAKTESAQLNVKIESLGTIIVKIDIAENAANIKFETDNKDAIKQLESNMGALKESFDKLGIKTENLNFELRQDSRESFQNFHRDGFKQNRKGNDFFTLISEKSADSIESEQTNTSQRIKQGRLIETYV